MYKELPDHNKVELEAFVDVVLGAGYQLSVYDGMDVWSDATDDRTEAIDMLGEMDSDQVNVFDNGNFVGWFWLVYGNEPGVLIADHTDNDACEGIYGTWAEKVGAA